VARCKPYFATETDLFAGVLAEGRRKREFVFSNAQATAHTLLLATNSLLPYSLSIRELGERAKIAANIERLAELLLHGLLRREV
jgi:hypothetical protein